MDNDFLAEIQQVLIAGKEEGILPDDLSLDDVLADDPEGEE